MFGIGMPELIIILVIALIVIGPKKLPDLAKSLGKGLSEFKKATSEIKEGLNLNEDLKEAREDLVDAVSGLDEPADSKKTAAVEDKPPKFEDFDEMLGDYHQEKVPSSTEAEKVLPLKDAEEKGRPEAPAEKDQNG
ncbi:MAG: twin-arginine translocase TatA/TatE family subunit [Deltaproteobacteria bacterium]|nr:twin-arginine translocase TatA/TatE family subunit [Deltaproteobacteria bacterium]